MSYSANALFVRGQAKKTSKYDENSCILSGTQSISYSCIHTVAFRLDLVDYVYADRFCYVCEVIVYACYSFSDSFSDCLWNRMDRGLVQQELERYLWFFSSSNLIQQNSKAVHLDIQTPVTHPV